MLGDLIGGIGSLIGGNKQAKAVKAENDRQYDLARNTIKYRKQDAENAGIHPLYALGAPTMSSASHVGGDGGISEASARVGDGINKMSSSYEKQMEALNLEHKRAEIDKTKAMTNDFIMQSKKASNLSRMDERTRSNADGKETMKFGGGVTVKPRYTPASEGEDYFGETGIPYTIWNTIDHLIEDAPKALETLKLMHDTKVQKHKNYWKKKYRDFAKPRGW